MAADAAPFPYLRWAKAYLDHEDPRSLAISGRQRPPAEEVGVPLPWPPGGPDAYTAWREAVGRHRDVDPAWVQPACGTSHANFIAYLALARGGRVACESPAYGSLTGSAEAVGATLTTFRRDPARGWRIDPDDLDLAIGDGVDLIAVTDLHNPSGQPLHAEDLALLCDVADKYEAIVLVDEVYQELDPADRPIAAKHHPRVLVTSSLTKAYGLWDLRAGWVIAQPEHVQAISAWDDLVCPTLAPGPLWQAATFLPTARPHLERTRAEAHRATEQVDRWIASRDDIHWTKPVGGFTGFLHFEEQRDGDALARRLWEEQKIRVVPGSFFQLPHGLRISYLRDETRLAELLACVGKVLDGS